MQIRLFDEMLSRIVGLRLYLVEAETNNFDPSDKKVAGGFGAECKKNSVLVVIVVLCDDIGDQTILSHLSYILVQLM